MDNRAWDGVAKLKDVVAQCRALLGPQIPITLLCHRQGATIAAAALQEGLQVDHVVMMGACLGYESVRTGARNTDLRDLARSYWRACFSKSFRSMSSQAASILPARRSSSCCRSCAASARLGQMNLEMTYPGVGQ
jgi:hypothetical protein